MFAQYQAGYQAQHLLMHGFCGVVSDQGLSPWSDISNFLGGMKPGYENYQPMTIRFSDICSSGFVHQDCFVTDG